VASGQPGHSVCADLAADERALSDVIELLDNSPADGPVTVEAFGSTPQYSHLVTIIGKNSRRPVIDRMTPDSYLESSRRLDSKVLAREYFEAARPRCAALRLTRALTVSGGPDLRKHVRHALKALGPVIVKTDFGAGGQAMGIVTSRWLLRRKLSRIVPAGYDGDLLIEEFLGTGDEALSVSYNGLVQDDGTTYSLCAGRHILQAGKYYMGSYLGLGAMPDDCAAQVQSAGEAIGQVAGSIGYRGPLNIDFLYRASDGASRWKSTRGAAWVLRWPKCASAFSARDTRNRFPRWPCTASRYTPASPAMPGCGMSCCAAGCSAGRPRAW
jgi:hypothetical protein